MFAASMFTEAFRPSLNMGRNIAQIISSKAWDRRNSSLIFYK